MQPKNLVQLCKFLILISLETDCFHRQRTHNINICIAGLNLRPGYATAYIHDNPPFQRSTHIAKTRDQITGIRTNTRSIHYNLHKAAAIHCV